MYDDSTYKMVKEIQKRPENRHCFDCSSRGNQYVVLNYSVFVCTACSGIHREQGHKIKSVGMSTFSIEEVNALECGGNAVAKAKKDAPVTAFASVATEVGMSDTPTVAHFEEKLREAEERLRATSKAANRAKVNPFADGRDLMHAKKEAAEAKHTVVMAKDALAAKVAEAAAIAARPAPTDLMSFY